MNTGPPVPASLVILSLLSFAVLALRAFALAFAASSPETRKSSTAFAVPAASAVSAASRTSTSSARSAMSTTSARIRGSPVLVTPEVPSHTGSAGVNVPGSNGAASAGVSCRNPASRRSAASRSRNACIVAGGKVGFGQRRGGGGISATHHQRRDNGRRG